MPAPGFGPSFQQSNEPLFNHERYYKLRDLNRCENLGPWGLAPGHSLACQRCDATCSAVCSSVRRPQSCPFRGMTLRGRSFAHRGAHGFVQLALDMETGEQVAIKFLERTGRKMKTKHILRCPLPPVLLPPC